MRGRAPREVAAGAAPRHEGDPSPVRAGASSVGDPGAAPAAGQRPAAGEYDVLARLRDRGALLQGHFRLSSGLHSSLYVQCALLLQHPEEAAAAGLALAARLRAELRWPAGKPPVVVSPALGGVVIGHELGRALGTRAVFAEREEGRMTLRRGFRVESEESAIVCEDVVTTGGSAREVVELLRRRGAKVLVAAALLFRGGGDPALGVPLVSLATLAAPTYDPAGCPLCAAGSEAVKPGSRGTKARPRLY